MNKKYIAFILLGLIIVAVAAFLLWPKTNNSANEIVGTVEAVNPPICTQNIPNPTCGDGLVIIKTDDGTTSQYRYKSDAAGPSNLDLRVMYKGAKVRIQTADGKITHVESY